MTALHADDNQKPHQHEYTVIVSFLNGIVFNGNSIDPGSYMKAYTCVHRILTHKITNDPTPLCTNVQRWVRQYAAHCTASDMMTLKWSRSKAYGQFAKLMRNLFSYMDKHYAIRLAGLCTLPEMCAKERQRAVADIRGAVTATVWCTKKSRINVPEEIWNLILSFMTMTRFVVTDGHLAPACDGRFSEPFT
jgi:hypothetical protein